MLLHFLMALVFSLNKVMGLVTWHTSESYGLQFEVLMNGNVILRVIVCLEKQQYEKQQYENGKMWVLRYILLRILLVTCQNHKLFEFGSISVH